MRQAAIACVLRKAYFGAQTWWLTPRAPYRRYLKPSPGAT